MNSLPPKILLECGRFRVEQISYRTGDGRQHTKEIVRHPGSVVILPWVTDDQLCLIQNHRPTIGQTLIELPAGTREAGEPPEQTACRELIEETGFRAERMEHLMSFYPAPGILDERMELYRATGLTAGIPQREPNEQIDNLIVTIEEALDLVNQGRIHDAKSLVGILWSVLQTTR